MVGSVGDICREKSLFEKKLRKADLIGRWLLWERSLPCKRKLGCGERDSTGIMNDDNEHHEEGHMDAPVNGIEAAMDETLKTVAEELQLMTDSSASVNEAQNAMDGVTDNTLFQNQDFPSFFSERTYSRILLPYHSSGELVTEKEIFSSSSFSTAHGGHERSTSPKVAPGPFTHTCEATYIKGLACVFTK